MAPGYRCLQERDIAKEFDDCREMLSENAGQVVVTGRPFVALRLCVLIFQVSRLSRAWLHGDVVLGHTTVT